MNVYDSTVLWLSLDPSITQQNAMLRSDPTARPMRLGRKSAVLLRTEAETNKPSSFAAAEPQAHPVRDAYTTTLVTKIMTTPRSGNIHDRRQTAISILHSPRPPTPWHVRSVILTPAAGIGKNPSMRTHRLTLRGRDVCDTLYIFGESGVHNSIPDIVLRYTV